MKPRAGRAHRRQTTPRRRPSRHSGFRRRARRVLTRLLGPIRRIVVRSVALSDVPGMTMRTWDIHRGSVETAEAERMRVHPLAAAARRAVYHPPPAVTAVLPDIYFASSYHTVFTSRRELIADSLSTGADAGFVSVMRLWRARLEHLSGLYSTHRSYQNTYYHTLIDNLPRLYLLQLMQPSLDTEVELLCCGGLNRAEASLLPRLLPEGARVRAVSADRFLRVERFVFLGFLTRRFSGWLPADCLDWYRSRVAPRRRPKRSRRIFISRLPTPSRFYRCILNEDELFASLAPLGFERFVLEDLEIEQQIELFHDAEFVIGPHGAGLANLVFARGLKVLELFPSRWVIPHYYYLCKACGHRYAYRCGSGANRNSNFVVDPAEIQRAINDLERS